MRRALRLLPLVLLSFVALLLSGCMGDEGSDGSRSGQAHSVELRWTAPDRRENGEPLNLGLIDHYQVYVSRESGAFREAPITARNTHLTLQDLAPGAWFVAVRTVDTDGRTSRFSEERRIVVR